jgi:hypothetical protein
VNAGDLDAALRQLASTMPGAVKFRVLSALEHFDRSSQLFDVDKEMASFRAITGEEEAATALIAAIRARRYRHAADFNPRDHQQKAAVMACVMAISTQMAPMLAEFQLTFDFEKKRIDVKVPLSNFNVAGGENYAIQPIEPLDLVHSVEGAGERRPFDEALKRLAARSNYENIKRMVSSQANARNVILYASDSSLPRSAATREALANRKTRGLILLVLSAMVLQSRKHLALVSQAIETFLGVVSRLPPPELTEA